MSAHGATLMCAHGCYWAFREHSWALISSHEHSWAWCHGPTALMSAEFSTRSALAPYSLMLRSAHERSWGLMSNPESSISWLSNKQKKYWFSKCLPLRILAISRSRYHQITTNWIVLKSTWKKCWEMSKIELLDVLEAEKLIKQKLKQYCGTPCIVYVCISIIMHKL